ncbi:MAG: carbohydrate ABC transporter permease [Armatimonadetes bacterium]|nr:carbohydrate ABC transporter permease [Armatimonadota bacterium]
MKKYIVNFIIYTFLIILAVIILFPFIWMLSTALKPAEELFSLPARIIPKHFAFENFKIAWSSAPFSRFFINSLIVALSATFITLIFSSLAGFAFAKYNFKGKEFLFICFLATLMIPFQVILIPNFIILAKLKPTCAEAFGIFLIRQYLYSIPNELMESARIDGCSELRIYWKIILPLMSPVLAVITIFSFMWRWNDFIWPLIVIDQEKMFTLQLGLARFKGEYFVEWSHIMAMGILSIIPILLIFIFCQKYFVQGISLTGSK